MPAPGSPTLRLFILSPKSLRHGVEVHRIEGVAVRVTSRAKTVADCFKFRNKIGLDVAIEALKAYLGKRGRSMDELDAAAAVCRVSRIMRPYIEAVA
jgi:predicted transcriptional regulator of viral defense system